MEIHQPHERSKRRCLVSMTDQDDRLCSGAEGTLSGTRRQMIVMMENDDDDGIVADRRHLTVCTSSIRVSNWSTEVVFRSLESSKRDKDKR